MDVVGAGVGSVEDLDSTIVTGVREERKPTSVVFDSTNGLV